MKRILSPTILACLLLLTAPLWLLAGCRGAKSGQQKIAFWSSLMGSKEVAREQLLKDYQQARPNAQAAHEGFFDIEEQNKKILVAMASGTPPDVASNLAYFVGRYAAAGQLQPLDDWMARDGITKDQFEPSFLEGCVFEGKTYALPIFGETWALFYNTELFKKAGLDPNQPPKTWEQLRDYAKKMTIWNGDTIQQGGLDVPYQVEDTMSDLFLTLLFQADGDFLSPDGKTVAFDGPAGVEALQFMVDLMRKDRVSQIGFGQGLDQTPQAPFNAGKMAMSMMGAWGIVNVATYSPDLPYAVAPLPSHKRTASFAGVFVLFVPKAAKNKDGAWDFIKFFLDTPNLAKFTKACYRSPSTLAAQQDPFFTDDPKMQVFVQAAGTSRMIPPIPQQSEILAAIQEQCQQAIYGKKTADQALKDAAAVANAAIQRGAVGVASP